MPSSYDELAWVSSWQLANLSRQIWAIVIADRPLLMADRAPKRELGPCWRSWGMTHIQPASQCLHQLVMGQPSHIPRLMICSRGRPLEISMQNRLCWGKHGSIISNTPTCDMQATNMQQLLMSDHCPASSTYAGHVSCSPSSVLQMHRPSLPRNGEYMHESTLRGHQELHKLPGNKLPRRCLPFL